MRALVAARDNRIIRSASGRNKLVATDHTIARIGAGPIIVSVHWRASNAAKCLERRRHADTWVSRSLCKNGGNASAGGFPPIVRKPLIERVPTIALHIERTERWFGALRHLPGSPVAFSCHLFWQTPKPPLALVFANLDARRQLTLS